MADDLTARLVEATQAFLKQKNEVRKSAHALNRLSEVKIFKRIEADIDQDGQPEICFIAGIPDLWGYSICGLLDFQSPDQIIELTSSEGFRDLQIFDINQDGLQEIVALWQVGSGAFLSLNIWQWDGKEVKSIFPQHRDTGFHQGFVELKDLDADGVDEIVIWEGRQERDGRWTPQRFDIHVFSYRRTTYEFKGTYTSDLYYSPMRIVRQEIDIFGRPVQFEHRSIPIDELRERLAKQIQNQQISEEFIQELGKHYSTLEHEGFHMEALEVADLAIEAATQLCDPVAKSFWQMAIRQQKGFALSFVGDYPNAINLYLEALSHWNEQVNDRLTTYAYPNLHRDLGITYLLTGDYEHALSSFSTAQNLLEKLDSSTEISDELSRLHSNFAFLFFRLGDYQQAITNVEKAIKLDKILRKPNGLIINYTNLGNFQRTAKRYQDATQSYQAALALLNEVSDRDRESDIYLGLGITLILDQQIQQGLAYLHKALLLATLENLKQQGAVHYLYLGLGYNESGNMQQAKQYFDRAIAFADEFKTPETKWQALYGLALIHQQQQQNEACQNALLQAINAIEKMRSQYLPEDLKVSLFADKIEPYETMVISSLPHQSGQAFSFVERAKSRVFMEQLAITPIANTVDIPMDLLQRESELINDLRRLQHQHRQAANQHYNWGHEIDQIENELEQLWGTISHIGDKSTEYVELRKAIPLNFDSVKSLLVNP